MNALGQSWNPLRPILRNCRLRALHATFRSGRPYIKIAGMNRAPLPFIALLAFAIYASPATAQLLDDRVVGDQRICIYVGSDQTADGQSVPRSSILPAAQPCPATAPYVDPNRPVPGNAALTGETTENNQRRCTYTQGGVTYQLMVPNTRRCAMTPDLLDRVDGDTDNIVGKQSVLGQP
jgi:hypothetical protein